jgi:2,3-diketo-5-methylthiopentyl-1-phosphate enolase
LSQDLNARERKLIVVNRQAIDIDQYFVLRLHLEPTEGLGLEEAAIKVLLILTGRTMRKLSYEPDDVRIKTSGHILSVDPRTRLVEIALPTHLCRPEEGLNQLMTVITSAAEYNYCDEYWVDDIELPRPFIAGFRGPRFGVSGLRALFGRGAEERPLIGVVMKPRQGVLLQGFLPLLKEALLGGCDFIADDLLLFDPLGEYSLDRRIPSIVKAVAEASLESGSKKGYFVNVGSSPQKTTQDALRAIEMGAFGLISNGYTMSFGGLTELVDAVNGAVPVLTCNMGGGILTRPRLMTAAGKPTGLSETVISKLSRMAGADGVHAGTSASECYGSSAWGPATRALQTPFFELRPSFAVAEGDLNINNLWANIEALGLDVMLEPTSGILASPGGPRRAATAFRDLASILNPEMGDEKAHKAIQSYARGHKDIRPMLDFFGYKDK